MSYDFSMDADLGGPERIIIFNDLNYTYNVANMYQQAFSLGSGINVIDGLLGYQAHDLILCAIKEMEDNFSDYEKLNPENGWGNAEGLRVH
jgi:hypothetical protein